MSVTNIDKWNKDWVKDYFEFTDLVDKFRKSAWDYWFNPTPEAHTAIQFQLEYIADLAKILELTFKDVDPSVEIRNV